MAKAPAAGGEDVDWDKVLKKAKGRALRGGAAGMAAMVLNVSTLMWMRTTVNYQYRNGGGMFNALRSIYAQGGVFRFYAGYPVAIFGAPIARFGDTAANEGVKSIIKAKYPDMSPFLVTAFTTLAASSWRLVIMPIEVTKTALQVEGTKKGIALLAKKIKTGGPGVMFHGGFGSAGASIVGNYPWWATWNALDETLPAYKGEDQFWMRTARNAGMGAMSSIVSDTCSNSLRVVKTYKQTYPTPISYTKAVQDVYAADGLGGLFGRGLMTKWLANGMQAAMFGVAFKGIKDKFDAMFAEEED